MRGIFKKICDINLDKKNSWQGKIFLTLDIDWACDEVLHYVIDIMEKYKNIKATWFLTHNTKVLERLLENKNFEVGIHPNFNNLLDGNFSLGRSKDEVIKRLMSIAPDAISVRSHSMTQSSQIIDNFFKRGLKFDCNHFIPHHSQNSIFPWKHWSGIVKVPYLWEDDIAILEKEHFKVSKIVKKDSINVFDFHPIHIYLNSSDLNAYNDSKKFMDNFDILKNYRNSDQEGVENWFRSFLELSNENSNYWKN